MTESGDLLTEVVAGADVAVVEGVMGLYDGLDATEEASTAQVAKALDIPVLLVINVHGMSRSAGAMEMGYATSTPVYGWPEQSSTA